VILYKPLIRPYDMKFTLFILLFLALSIGSAQKTYDIDWKVGATGDAASLTIETGDTVRWIWGDEAYHDVVSNDADAPDDFKSGDYVVAEKGYIYSYTFTEEAEIDYFCSAHEFTMYGTITVVNNLGFPAQKQPSFKIYPNPVKDRIYFQNRTTKGNINVTFYDILGKVVKKELLSTVSMRNGMDVSNLKRGVYLVQIDNGSNSFTQKLIKN
ncbi:MAG: T9SS type A sorting domain-containing protein, partial [Leeuwenhoekiella sp.]